jgi:uncharacterized protein
MREARQSDYSVQGKLVRTLLDSLRKQMSARNVRMVETHISWVLLAGNFAYKIKKAVNLGFLDFSTLESRHYYCEEEIRLNRRMAPALYLDVVAIGGSAEAPVLGGQPAMEYAVRMRRFAVSQQLDRLVAGNKILPQHIDSLAATIASFHGNLPAAVASSPFGTAAAIHQAAQQNFEALQACLKDSADLAALSALRHASNIEYAARQNLFDQRRLHGFVRECHGDLHLANIVLLDAQPTPFDGIEFNPALRWIDVINEIAFTVMDLQHHQRADLASRFLNAWLEATGDYAGIPLLRFYIAYRAMVRAKVSAIRAAQEGISDQTMAEAWASCRGYLALATECFASKRAALIITHGLPGSGKTTFSRIALERLQAIRLRSDVERKRMYGLASLADSRERAGVDLYGADISQRTYARLHELASVMLTAGYRVIVDAAFLQQAERDRFKQLAHQLAVPFVIVSLYAGTDALRARITQRRHAANDASEADIAVLEKLQLIQQPLSLEERNRSVVFDNEGAGINADSAAWGRLQQLLD